MMLLCSRPLVLGIVLLFLGGPAWGQGARQRAAFVDQDSFGPARFSAPIVVTGERRRFESLLDLDDDADADIFGWFWKDYEYRFANVTGWINRGDGTFNERWTFQIDSFVIGAGEANFRGAAVGNLDGDGRQDFALAFWDKVFLYSSNGALAPSLFDLVVVSTSLRGFVLADFDGDGLDDLAAYDGSLRLYRNEGSGQPLSATQIYTTPNNTNLTILAVEANGDSTPDLLYDYAGVFHFLYVEDGVIAGESTLAHGHAAGAQQKNLLVAGDVEGDGDLDVVAFDSGGGIFVARRTGAASFVVEPKVDDAGPATHLVDIDADGDLDGLCCGSGGGDPAPPYNSSPSFFEISIHDGGVFRPAFRIQGLGSHHLAGASDLDADGDLDLVAGRTILWNDGGLHQPPPLDATTGSAALPQAVVPESVGDFEGDGDADLGIGLGSFVRTHGNGDFDQAVTAADAPAFGAWDGPGVVGDFDGDGDLDLLVSRVASVFRDVHLLANSGGVLRDAGLALAPGIDPSAGMLSCRDDPACYRVADLDADGDQDFVSPGASVFWNDGTGFFVQGASFPGERIQAVRDLDGDGLDDLVLTSSAVLVRLNLGSGAFAAPIVLPSSIALDSRPALGDFDGDGRCDIAHADSATERVKIHWNEGAGSFTTAGNPLFLPASVQHVRAVDVNRDGADDVFAWPVSLASDTSILVTSRGNRAFEPAIRQVLVPSAFVDVDADGDLDAVGSAIVLNNRRLNPEAGLRRQYGSGSPGACSTDPAPVLGASGPFRAGTTFTYRMCGIEPGALGVLTIGRHASALPNTPSIGLTALNWPWQQQILLPPATGNAGVPGSGGVTLASWISPALARSGSVFAQAFFTTSCAPSTYAATNGLELDFGF